jgi:hypothetical protein
VQAGDGRQVVFDRASLERLRRREPQRAVAAARVASANRSTGPTIGSSCSRKKRSSRPKS